MHSHHRSLDSFLSAGSDCLEKKEDAEEICKRPINSERFHHSFILQHPHHQIQGVSVSQKANFSGIGGY